MKFNIATLVATACANPLTAKTDSVNLHNVEDTLTAGVMIDTQPTMESVPDLKDFLSTLYGEALTDDQILSMLIGSTPSPQIDNYETTAAAIVDDVEADTGLMTDIATEKSTDQELVHVLNAEMNLIESLKKTEIELAEELRELQILKVQQNVLLGGDAVLIDVELSSSTQLTRFTRSQLVNASRNINCLKQNILQLTQDEQTSDEF